MSQADPTAAIVALLAGRASISALAGTDVYGEELPDSPAFIASMPKHAIAVQSTGGIGPGDDTYLPLGGQRVDVNFYGATMFDARRLARAGHDVLKAVRRELVTYDDENGNPVSVLIHGFLVSTGYLALRERETRWPRVLRTYTALYAEQEVS